MSSPIPTPSSPTTSLAALSLSTSSDDITPTPSSSSSSVPNGTTSQPTVLVRDMVSSLPASTASSLPSSVPATTLAPNPTAAPPTSTPTPTTRPTPTRPTPTANPPRPVIGGPPGRVPMRAGMGMAAGGGMGMGQSRLPPSLQAKMDAMAKKAANLPTPTPPTGPPGSLPPPSSGLPDPTSLSALLASASRPSPAPRPMAIGGLAARRAPLAGAAGGRPLGGAPTGGLGRMNRPGAPGMTLSQMGMGQGTLGGGAGGPPRPGGRQDNAFANFGKIVDPSGRLTFSTKAVVHAGGVEFSNGDTFKINMEEMQLEEELGKGNYGTVQRVLHKPTKVVMAMKEIRLELDESKLAAIIMELDILHRAVAPEIVEFYGAFTIESCVYYCMEFMDAGSLDQMHGDGVPEDVLARITKSMVKGLGFLKDSLEIMHRDVKPTNVLVNKKGEIKLCDFGVSGQLEKSLAKTNIGCQSYMAPERIKGESENNLGTYTASSDVWSVGLSIIELAKGCYPYPPETFANILVQLQAIVYGPPPTLPEQYSATAQDFVASCLRKQPDLRPTYSQLLKHPWMLEDAAREVDMVGWVAKALEAKAARQKNGIPISSSAPEIVPSGAVMKKVTAVVG